MLKIIAKTATELAINKAIAINELDYLYNNKVPKVLCAHNRCHKTSLQMLRISSFVRQFCNESKEPIKISFLESKSLVWL